MRGSAIGGRDVGVDFALPAPATIDVSIYDVTGRLVRTLAHRTAPAERHSVRWNGKSAGGERVAAGVYFVRLVTGEAAITRRIVVAR